MRASPSSCAAMPHYDHGCTVASFIDDHIRFHARNLAG
jgi:hypothetical protein